MTNDAKRLIDAHAESFRMEAKLCRMQAELALFMGQVRFRQLAEKAEQAGFTKDHPLVKHLVAQAEGMKLDIPTLDIPAPEIPKIDLLSITPTLTPKP